MTPGLDWFLWGRQSLVMLLKGILIKCPGVCALGNVPQSSRIEVIAQSQSEVVNNKITADKII